RQGGTAGGAPASNGEASNASNVSGTRCPRCLLLRELRQSPVDSLDGRALLAIEILRRCTLLSRYQRPARRDPLAGIETCLAGQLRLTSIVKRLHRDLTICSDCISRHRLGITNLLNIACSPACIILWKLAARLFEITPVPGINSRYVSSEDSHRFDNHESLRRSRARNGESRVLPVSRRAQLVTIEPQRRQTEGIAAVSHTHS